MSGAHHDKQGVALMSVFASAALTLAKLTVGLMSGSLAVLAEAGHSALDFGATLVTLFAVRAADAPADDEHHYGHGKIESLAALAETALLFLLSGLVIVEGIKRLMGDEPAVPVTPIMIGVLVISIVVDFWRSRALTEAAEQHQSDALEADALHFYADMLGSGMALIGLIAVWLGYAKGDAIAAIAVAVFICVLGWKLGRRTVDNLLDRAPAGLADQVRAAALAVPGVVDVADVKLRRVGAQTLGEVTLKVSRALALDRVMEIKQQVTQAVQAVDAGLRPTIAANSVALDDESIMERVHLIARHRAHAIHHVTVHQVGERVAIGLDLEVDGTMPLARAHEVASALEEAVKADIGPATEIEVHVEPLQVSTLIGTDAPAEQVAAIGAALSAAAAPTLISDVHNVRVRQTGDGLIVHFHCRATPQTPVEAVHTAIDAIERTMRRSFPQVIRVVSHAEPLRGAA